VVTDSFQPLILMNNRFGSQEPIHEHAQAIAPYFESIGMELIVRLKRIDGVIISALGRHEYVAAPGAKSKEPTIDASTARPVISAAYV
jgi:hypothetical protein